MRYLLSALIVAVPFAVVTGEMKSGFAAGVCATLLSFLVSGVTEQEHTTST